MHQSSRGKFLYTLTLLLVRGWFLAHPLQQGGYLVRKILALMSLRVAGAEDASISRQSRQLLLPFLLSQVLMHNLPFGTCPQSERIPRIWCVTTVLDIPRHFICSSVNAVTGETGKDGTSKLRRQVMHVRAVVVPRRQVSRPHFHGIKGQLL